MKIGTVARIALIGTLAVLFQGCSGGKPLVRGTTKTNISSEKTTTIQTGFETTLKDWEFVEGDWQRRKSDGQGVLAQTATDRRYPVALWKRQRFSNVDVTVRFRPISGEIDASGGIVFRAKDGEDYYVVRANSLEDNYRLYTVTGGRRSQIAGTSIDAPALGQWHTLRVVAVGSRIQAYLNGELLIDHRDETFSTGWVGLWTKADAVTEFDDLMVEGLPSHGGR